MSLSNYGTVTSLMRLCVLYIGIAVNQNIHQGAQSQKFANSTTKHGECGGGIANVHPA